MDKLDALVGMLRSQGIKYSEFQVKETCKLMKLGKLYYKHKYRTNFEQKREDKKQYLREYSKEWRNKKNDNSEKRT